MKGPDFPHLQLRSRAFPCPVSPSDSFFIHSPNTRIEHHWCKALSRGTGTKQVKRNLSLRGPSVVTATWGCPWHLACLGGLQGSLCNPSADPASRVPETMSRQAKQTEGLSRGVGRRSPCPAPSPRFHLFPLAQAGASRCRSTFRSQEHVLSQKTGRLPVVNKFFKTKSSTLPNSGSSKSLLITSLQQRVSLTRQ